ncbi:lipase/acylhydrolase with GDSL-like motif [Renibacterium salmoninarum ATCC 33209]|uniref:Lipase/acylhydrolase with GDSL-like motif n=1 Tax=Renibacterium salmoninarum (strain ATCC 33209 / DSM 20767 / JCM 11484 / NBRC 15589 / NCIMB 2235) TaxID=288705 RepID=A9WTS0_RENSM|nr:SGNH/GDSL hydrolase family protein [Renibacterium salmoninarum]ABY24591.1 lipase/acylhydrolase with GDSL-like motif [Renibacterium salmoninarum ATCC 33209]
MDFANRYLALGDSFTEGVGDHAPDLPNGVRGWADVVAAQLAEQNGDWGYANLAIRGRKMGQILDEQLAPALAMKPTLVTIYSGVNDLMRPTVDIDALMVRYDEAIGALVAAGAQVAMFTGFDAKVSKIFARLRGRTAIYNELVREISDKHGTLLIDFWRFREFDDWRMWAEDRIHMSTAGHQRMAQRVLGVLGKPSTLAEPALPVFAAKSTSERLKAQAEWTCDHVGPWIGRRVRGASSGDELDPRWPELRNPLS